MTTSEALCVLETALICLGRPLTLSEMAILFDSEVGTDTLRALLDALAERYKDKGVELVCVATGWRLQGKPEMQELLGRMAPGRTPRYSKAVLETLAVIVHRQPVTRADIEEFRGVSVSSSLLHQLEARGWVEIIGHRDSPGRPGLYATTSKLLDELDLVSLDELTVEDEELAKEISNQQSEGPFSEDMEAWAADDAEFEASAQPLELPLPENIAQNGTPAT